MTPQTEEDLAALIRDAKGPVRVQGGGTRPIGRPGPGEALSTAGISGITLYDPGALTIVVKTGTPVSEVEAALEAEGQRLAFEPTDHREILGTTGTPTIGGVVATNTSGPRRIAVGACRDFLLGVRLVDGAGTVLKNGGRVMKNVTGYDLVKLMCGAHGTLGILTEVSLKVLPKPEATATLTLPGLDDARAVEAMSAALGSPFEVTGAAHLPTGPGQTPVTHLRIEGFAGSVNYRAEELRKRLTEFGTPDIRLSTDGNDTGPLWKAVRDVTALAAEQGDLWRISVRPSEAAGLAPHLGATALQYDWGGGLIWAVTPPGHDLRAALAGHGGHATRLRAMDPTGDTLPAFHPEAAPVASLSRGLRQKFDPRGLLNPGLMT